MKHNNDSQFLHPEVHKEIIKEFHRLKKNHPDMDGESLMSMSRDYVWTVCLADSLNIRTSILIGSR